MATASRGVVFCSPRRYALVSCLVFLREPLADVVVVIGVVVVEDVAVSVALGLLVAAAAPAPDDDTDRSRLWGAEGVPLPTRFSEPNGDDVDPLSESAGDATLELPVTVSDSARMPPVVLAAALASHSGVLDDEGGTDDDGKDDVVPS